MKASLGIISKWDLTLFVVPRFLLLIAPFAWRDANLYLFIISGIGSIGQFYCFFSLGLWKFTVFTCTLMVSILNWKRLMFLVNIYMIFCERKYDEPYSMFTGHVRHWNERCPRISQEHGRHAVCPGSQSLRNQYCVRWGKVHTWEMTVRRQKQRALVDHVGGWGGRSTGVQKTHGRCRYLSDSQSLWHAHGLRWGSASRFGDVLLHVFFVQKQWGVRVDPVRVCW